MIPNVFNLFLISSSMFVLNQFQDRVASVSSSSPRHMTILYPHAIFYPEGGEGGWQKSGFATTPRPLKIDQVTKLSVAKFSIGTEFAPKLK